MKKLCGVCRQLVEASDWSAHRQWHANQGKASSSARGYGAAHRALKKDLEKKARSGGMICARFPLGQCLLADRPEGPVILPTDETELDHDDTDRSRYLGLSHQQCNRATAGRR